jgi:DNA polymerase alpha subunit A
MLELFILKRKIKGPCWLTITGAKKDGNVNKTWCIHELCVNSPKDIVATVDDINRESPPLIALNMSIKTTRS